MSVVSHDCGDNKRTHKGVCKVDENLPIWNIYMIDDVE